MKKYIQSNTGTPYDFLSEVENRIAELSGSGDVIDSAQDITANQDMYDDNEYATRDVDVYDYIRVKMPYYSKRFGFRLENSSGEFFAILDDADRDLTIIDEDDMQMMADENWKFAEINEFVLDELEAVKNRFGHRLRSW